MGDGHSEAGDGPDGGGAGGSKAAAAGSKAARTFGGAKGQVAFSTFWQGYEYTRRFRCCSFIVDVFVHISVGYFDCNSSSEVYRCTHLCVHVHA